MYGANPSQQGMMNGAPPQGQYQPGRGQPQAMQGMNPMTVQHSQMQPMPQHGSMSMGSHPGQMYSTPGSNPGIYPVGMGSAHYPNSSPRFVNMQQPGINMQDKTNMAMQQHSQYSAIPSADYDVMSRSGYSSQPTMSYSSNSMQHVRMQHGGMPTQANMQTMQGRYPTTAYGNVGHNNHMGRIHPPGGNSMNSGKMDLRPQGIHSNISNYNQMQQNVPAKQPLPTVDTGSYMQRPPSVDKSKQPGYYSSLPNPTNQSYPTSYSNSMGENVHRMSYTEASRVRMQQPQQRATTPHTPNQMSNQLQRPNYPNHQSHQSQYLGSNLPMPQTVSPGQNIPPASPHLQAPALTPSPAPGTSNVGQRSRVPHHQGPMPMRSPITYDNQGPMSPRMNFPNQSPRSYQNNANFNHMPQSPSLNANATPAASYGNRFLSPKPNVSSTMSHQQAQSGQKPVYHMNQMQAPHAGPGNQQFQPNRLPEPQHSAYAGNQWPHAPSMQSPPGMQQSPVQPSPLSSPTSNQITPQKPQQIQQRGLSIPNLNNKSLPDPNIANTDFNLDSLLSDPMDTGGSFMQQLQGINTTNVPQSKTTLETNLNQQANNNILQKQNSLQQNSLENNQLLNPPHPSMNLESNIMTNNIAPNLNQQQSAIEPRPNERTVTTSLPPQLPTLENINFNKDTDSINGPTNIAKQDNMRQQQSSIDVASLSANNSLTSPPHSAHPDSNSKDIRKSSEGEMPPFSQAILSTANSIPQVPTNTVTLSSQPQAPNFNASNEPVKPTSTFGSPPHSAENLPQFNAQKIPPNNNSQIGVFPKTSTTLPPGNASDQLNEATSTSSVNTVPPHPTTMAHVSSMSSPTKTRFPTPTDVNSMPTVPQTSVQPPHSTPQASIPNRMPLSHPMQGPNFQPTSMDPRMPNQIQRLPTDGSMQPHGYRQMGPQPAMPNAPYPHGHPGQPGPRMYPYPPRPYNPNMQQMNYMPRPGAMHPEMRGPMRYGPPQGMPPHIHQQHQHLQMLERDIQSLRMQARTEQHPPRIEEITRRLAELEGRRHHMIQQLHHQGGQIPGIELTPPPTGVMPPGAEEMSTKKKRLRKKDGKDLEDSDKKDKPPKKKKKKELIPGSSSKNKKKGKKSRDDSDEAAYMPIMSEPGSDGSMPYAPIMSDAPTMPPAADTVVSEDPTYMLPQPMKRKKNLGATSQQDTGSMVTGLSRPPATIVKPKKKKRKRGEESDEEHMLKATPPPSPDDSLLEKRRSSRNVKRKRYIETIELHLSDDGADHHDEGEMLKQQQAAVKQDTGTDEDQLIVDKVLSHRMRKIPIYKSPQKTPLPPTTNEEIKEKTNEALDTVKEPTAVTTESENNTVNKDNSQDAENGGNDEDTSLQLDQQNTVHPSPHKPTVEPKLPEPEIVGYNEVEEFLIKHKNYSYLHCDWKTLDEIGDKRADAKIKRYKSKIAQMTDFATLQFDNDEPFNPDFTVVDRVLDVSVQHDETGKPIKHYLVKWCALPYEDSTWESQESIDPVKIKEFEIRCSYRPPDLKIMVPPKHSWRKLSLQDSYFKNNNMLRDYQLEGISWMLFNWYNRRNCILADEMGLGKTIQSITFLQKIFDHGIKGPFLIVAPLSTIANWQREFESWTDINAVVYHGSQTSRDMIQTYEFMCRDENLDEIPDKYKLHAVITTYEMIVLESSHLAEVDWRCLIIDEAHRLKNRTCKLADSLNSMELEFKVLLTGTPLQNNIEELFALLNFLQPDTFNSEQAFSYEFGTLKDNAQVEKLQELLKPMMLRRLKEDVEKSIAPKEETIIEVELTNIQKKYYRAILERNFEFLSKGTTSGNVPNLMNTMMELRKCCNHPYLIKGAEDKIQAEYLADHPDDFNSLQVMIQSAGKLVLIDKLLPKLKANGHKVLIFSQMVKCLDILEDYLMQNNHFYERIDGCVRGNDRQMAIDRFSKPGSDRFVFLLCTRAGGLGINLTAADTVIIFDSDWNPQNDLQAQARCHRIGQQKSVKVYRLITRNSYEREMFDKASMKLGLDKAVLQSISGRQDQSMPQQQALTKHEVEDLLKRGAYGAIMDDDDDANKFCEEDIDQILQRRTHTITIESEKGSTFSKASFVSAEDRTDISLDDPNFWEKWAKKADLDLDRMTNNKLIIEEPRRRKQTRRFGGMTADDEVLAEIGSDSDSDYEDRPNTRNKKNKLKSVWSRRDCFRVIKSLLTFGWGRWKTILAKCGFPNFVTEQDLEEISRAVLIYCLKFYNGDEKIKVFIWDLITPAGHASLTGVDFKNHEGLAAPVPRGRKGRKAKEETERKQQIVERDWAKDIKVDSILQDDGFKKHLQHQCNKVLLRIRTLYYLRTEILGPYGPSIEEGASAKSLDIEIPEKVGDPLTSWWDSDCDKSLLIGIYKHGYEKYNLMRADSNLCFLDKVGRPDEKALAAELEVEEDAGADPEYKPAKVVFNDYSEFDESPAPNTPNTEPASPADDKDSTKSEPVKDKPAPVLAGEWPLISELNMRMRRLITCFQKHYKLMQARMMNIERRNMRRERMSESPRYRKEFQARWTRREETDFYRTISTFGVEYNDKSDLTWARFRNLAKLDRKSDESLRNYYLAFKAMCERIAGQKNITAVPKDAANIQIDPISEERASRTLYRLQTLDKVRLDVLKHKDLDERLQLCQPSLDLPVWWVPVKHDKELLLGMDRHGITRTEIHILSDPSLSFLHSMKDFESKPLKEQKLLLSMQKFGDEISERINNAGKIEISDLDSKVDSKKDNKNTEDDGNNVLNKNEETLSTIKTENSEPKDSPLKETSVIKSVEKLMSKTEDTPIIKKETKNEKIVGVTETKENIKETKTQPPELDDKQEKMNVDVNEDKFDKTSKQQEEDSDAPVHEKCDEKSEVQSPKKDDDDNTVIKQQDDKDNKISSPKKDEVKKSDNTEKLNESEKSLSSEEKESKEPAPVKAEVKKEEGDTNIGEKTETKVEKWEDESKEKAESESKPTEITHSASMNNLDDMVNFIQNQTLITKWPKDRILVQRVEHICHCVLNGEWPTAKESSELSITPSLYAGSGTSSPMGGSTPHAMDSPRQSPVPTSKMHHSASMGGLSAAELSNLNPMMMSENELIAAMLQMQQHQQQGSNKGYNTPGRSRGRRKKKGGRPMSPRNQNSRLMQQVAEQHAKEQQELQRHLEEMYLLNSFTQAQSSSKHKSSDKSGDFFPDLSSIKQSMLKSGSKEESSLGNSSASLLAKLQELATTAKPDKESSQDQWLRNAHKQSKDSKSRSSDYGSSSKHSSRHQALDNPFQLPPEMLASMPFNQLLQESLKSGNPNLFPLLMDPNFLLNESAKLMQQQAGQSSSSSKMNMPALSQAELDKLFQSMPELALSLFPPGLLPQFSPMQKPSSSKKQDKQEKSRSKDTLSSKIQSLEMANEQALQSISKDYLDKHNNKEDAAPKSKSDQDSVKSSPLSLASELASKLPTKSPARKPSKLDAMFGGGAGSKIIDASPKSASGRTLKKSKKSKLGFISPAVLPPDTRIPVHNSSEGKKYSGEDAPLNKDLADWLNQNPGFVVDYQVLRQQLDESNEPPATAEVKTTKLEAKSEKTDPPRAESPTPSVESETSLRQSNKSPVPSKHGSKHISSSRSSTPSHNKTQTPAKNNVSPSPSLKQQEALFGNNPFANLPPNFMNSFQGLPPDFAALVASGLMPGIPGMPFPKLPGQEMNFNQLPGSGGHSSSRSSQKESRRKDKGEKDHHRSKDRDRDDSRSSEKQKDTGGRTSQQSASNFSNQEAMAAESAFAAALGAGMMPGGLMADPLQLMAAMQASGMQVDPKALAGLPMLPFLGGMPGANPMFPGFLSPEAAAAAMEGLPGSSSGSSKRESSEQSNSDLKKYSSNKESGTKTSSSSKSTSSSKSQFPSHGGALANDPFAEALMALQMSGGNIGNLAGNPFLHPSQANMMMPPMMGMNNMGMPEMFSPDALLQAQLSALGGVGGLPFPMDLKPPTSSSSKKTRSITPQSFSSSNSAKSEGRHSTKSKDETKSNSGSKCEEEPMDLTQH